MRVTNFFLYSNRAMTAAGQFFFPNRRKLMDYSRLKNILNWMLKLREVTSYVLVSILSAAPGSGWDSLLHFWCDKASIGLKGAANSFLFINVRASWSSFPLFQCLVNVIVSNDIPYSATFGNANPSNFLSVYNLHFMFIQGIFPLLCCSQHPPN